MTEAAISQAASVKDWDIEYIGFSSVQDASNSNYMFIDTAMQLPFDEQITMETPAKFTGIIEIEIPTSDWEAAKTAKGELNIWATVANPRNNSKHLGVRCHVPDVAEPKMEIQNFYGDNMRLD